MQVGNKESLLRVRMTAYEKKQLKETAALLGISISDLVRALMAANLDILRKWRLEIIELETALDEISYNSATLINAIAEATPKKEKNPDVSVMNKRVSMPT